MALSEANQWVLKLFPLYEHVFTLQEGNPGLPFDQVYDLSSIQPRDFWLKLYDQVKAELKSMGLSL
jgi:hypothetical protein